jgi:hypothetical protein
METMAMRTLVTQVFLSKVDALNLLERQLGVSRLRWEPADDRLALAEGVELSIEVPKFGEDLPLTLDCHHDDPVVLERVVTEFATQLKDTVGWETRPLALGR